LAACSWTSGYSTRRSGNWLKDQSKDRKLALYYWGDALHRQGDYKQAAEKYEDAIKVDSEYADAYVQLGYVRAGQERFDDAIEQYRQANELGRKKQSKERKKAFWAWADALHQQNNYEQAVVKYREAIDIGENDPLTYYYLGEEFAAQERFDKAIEQYCQAAELWKTKESPTRKYALWGWGSALLQQEKFDEAIDRFRRAVEIVPPDFGAVCNYGYSLAELGSYRDAIEQFEWASSLDQDDPFPA
jgi:tetratricopeptide (TPR) repeat protein